MSSISKDKSGGWRIQFVSGARVRKTIRLPKSLTKRNVEEVQRRVDELNKVAILGLSWPIDLASWVANLEPTLYAKLEKVALVEAREQPGKRLLGDLVDEFLRLSPGKYSTQQVQKQACSSLLDYFGRDESLSAITRKRAEDWRHWIANDTKSGRRRRLTPDNRLSPATVAKRVLNARMVFSRAVDWEWIDKNPFAKLKAGSQTNPDRLVYIERERIERIIAVCPTSRWKLILGLARYAALRSPSEIIAATWEDLATKPGHLIVRSKKTEHHGGRHVRREVPVEPRLRELLDEHQSATGRSTGPIIELVGSSENPNFTTTIKKIIRRAGDQPWERLMQNLRSSCENDWMKSVGPHDAARWTGHSTRVQTEHYYQYRNSSADSVISGAFLSGGEVAQKAAQQVAASAGNTVQPATSPVDSNASNSAFEPLTWEVNNCTMGSTGFELTASFS